MNKQIYRAIPQDIKTLLLISEGWLVGGATQSLVDKKVPNDYDVVVTNRELFQVACSYLKTIAEVRINSFGGIKADIGGVLSVDMWCEELAHFITNANKQTPLFNYKKQILLNPS